MIDHSERGRRGGLATVARHGRAHMANIGRRGQAVTTARYWAGNGAEHHDWLSRAGLRAQDLSMSEGGALRYVERDPGEHPARLVGPGQRGLFEGVS